ncbi:unnamed protein product [Gongylonema pulchrum]|uniref:BTB domain-containing protein n=1 Tax=Gongylonema pulchrum TaxID=637853 RepID=A0A183E8W7_9BILA|nr:unnamed protein product [Gongylonema pulchrum]
MRTDFWDDLSSAESIVFEDIPYNVGCDVLKWMYTDELNGQADIHYLMEIYTAAMKLHLVDLQKKCELILYGRIDGDNCLLLYEFAARNDLERLREETGRVVKVRWKQFEDDFANLPAPILYRLVKR